MHCIIYEITTQPVAKEDYQSEKCFYDASFLGEIADYVYSDIDRKECLQDFREWFEKQKLGSYAEDSDSFTLTAEGKTNHFKEKFEIFQTQLKKLSKITLEVFSTGGNGIEENMRKLNKSYSDEFENYVSSEEFGTIPFDEFIRFAKVGKKYYIGGVLGYHY